MSDSYSTIKAALDNLIKNNPVTLIRGAVGNQFWTKCLQFAKDRILGKEVADISTISDLQIIYWDATSGTFKFKDPPAGGTGTDDHYLLSHIGSGEYTHYKLDGYLICGADLTVQSNSIPVSGLERSFGVLKNGTMQCNGIYSSPANWERGNFLKLEFKDVITLGHGISIQGGISFSFQSGSNYTTKQGDIIYFWYGGSYMHEINGVSLFKKNESEHIDLQGDINNNSDNISDNAEGVARTNAIYNKGTQINLNSTILEIPSTNDSFDIEEDASAELKQISITPSNGGSNYTKGKIIRLKFVNGEFDVFNNTTPTGNNYGIKLKKGSDYNTSVNDILVLMLDDDGYWYEINNLTRTIAGTNEFDDYGFTSMVVTGANITDGTNANTLKILDCHVMLRTSNNTIGNLQQYDISEVDNIEIPLLETFYYIVINYNAGSPIFALQTAEPNGNSIIPIGRVYKDSAGVFYIEGGFRFQNAFKTIEERDNLLYNFRLASGCAISVGNRNIISTSGIAYRGINKFVIDALDTSVSDTFIDVYNDGNWQYISDATQVNNTQYNDYGVGLANLSQNQYGVFWMFRNPTTQHCALLMGTDSYTLADAQALNEINNIPIKISAFGVPIGKIIIQKGATTFIFQKIGTISLGFIGQFDHNDLINKGSIDHSKIDAKFVKGTDIASATTITIPTDGEFCEVTGTNAINLIETAGYVAGKTIALKFTGICSLAYETATSGTAVGVHFVKGFGYTTVAGDVLILKFDGTLWQEVNDLTSVKWVDDGNGNIRYDGGDVGLGIAPVDNKIHIRALTEIQDFVFTGTGADDLTVGGKYAGLAVNTDYKVEIDYGQLSGTITNIVDYNATEPLTIKITSVGHGLEEHNIIDITGTINYNGNYDVHYIDADNFYVEKTWVADETSGSWVRNESFKWSDDDGVTWESTKILITGAAQTLNNGVTISFKAVIGHVTGDIWTFTGYVSNPVLVEDESGNTIVQIKNDGEITNILQYNRANEISAIPEKITLTDNDLVIIEDSENGFVKKKAKKSSIGGDITRNYTNPSVNVTIQDSGTAESGTATTITDNDKSWTSDEWIGYYVHITAGTGSGQIKKITDNDATSLTADFDIAPDNTSEYSIIPSTLTLDFAAKNEVFATLSGGGAIVIENDITIVYSNNTNFKSAWLAIEVKTATRIITFPISHKSGDYRFDTLTLTLGIGFYQISLINNGSYVSILCSESEV